MGIIIEQQPPLLAPLLWLHARPLRTQLTSTWIITCNNTTTTPPPHTHTHPTRHTHTTLHEHLFFFFSIVALWCCVTSAVHQSQSTIFIHISPHSRASLLHGHLNSPPVRKLSLRKAGSLELGSHDLSAELGELLTPGLSAFHNFMCILAPSSEWGQCI